MGPGLRRNPYLPAQRKPGAALPEQPERDPRERQIGEDEPPERRVDQAPPFAPNRPPPRSAQPAIDRRARHRPRHRVLAQEMKQRRIDVVQHLRPAVIDPARRVRGAKRDRRADIDERSLRREPQEQRVVLREHPLVAPARLPRRRGRHEAEARVDLASAQQAGQGVERRGRRRGLDRGLAQPRQRLVIRPVGFGPAERQHGIGMPQHRGAQHRRRPRQQHVVGIDELDQRKSRRREPHVGGDTRAAVRARQDAGIGPARGQPRQCLGRAVGRAVIDKDELALEIARLPRQPLDHRGEKRALVVDRDDKADARRVAVVGRRHRRRQLAMRLAQWAS